MKALRIYSIAFIIVIILILASDLANGIEPGDSLVAILLFAPVLYLLIKQG